MEHGPDRERMLRGEPYNAMAPQLRAERAASRALVERFNATPHADAAGRDAVLRELIGQVGEGVDVLAPFQCDYGTHVSIGDRTFINYGAVILDAATVQIGADVLIGPNVQLITALHPLDADVRRTGEETAQPIVIGEDVWLAAGVIVLPGVTIGARAVVGAGSIVTRDLPGGHLCLGNPCRPVRPL